MACRQLSPSVLGGRARWGDGGVAVDFPFGDGGDAGLGAGVQGSERRGLSVRYFFVGRGYIRLMRKDLEQFDFLMEF